MCGFFATCAVTKLLVASKQKNPIRLQTASSVHLSGEMKSHERMRQMLLFNNKSEINAIYSSDGDDVQVFGLMISGEEVASAHHLCLTGRFWKFL